MITYPPNISHMITYILTKQNEIYVRVTLYMHLQIMFPNFFTSVKAVHKLLFSTSHYEICVREIFVNVATLTQYFALILQINRIGEKLKSTLKHGVMAKLSKQDL